MSSNNGNHKRSSLDQIQRKPSSEEFFIVGIGASAGGIEALQEFFRRVPQDSGMAYVVILHLSPDHDSQLASVLQRETTLPVIKVTERVQIVPDKVYVVPPNQHLTIDGDSIAVSINTSIEERRAPVDIFFRSLAEEFGPRSIAVILSGTGANGSMGLKRVKERGGACFVQNPREAEFNEMSRNAISTDMVDEVLSVSDIPAKIISYKTSLGRVEITADAQETPEFQQQALREIFTQIRITTGHDFSNYKRPTLLRRLERRINIHSLPDLPAYARLLVDQPEEVNFLLKDLLISVTNFFRDKKPFEVLEQEVLQAIFKGKTHKDQVRIWVAGCATGEEAYSLAILCAEKTIGVIDAPRVQIFATDIDESSIAQAREGLYTINDAADVSPERLRQFFVKEGDSYRIRREVRETVMFAHHNFLKDPPFSHLDLVSCRNVMIYLNQVAQERVVETFHFALKPGSFLFLGTSESVDGAADLYAPFNRESHIFRSRLVTPRAYPIPDSTPAIYFEKTRSQLVSQQQENKILNRISFGDLHQQLLEEYAPPSLIINEEYDILHLSEKAGRFLQIGGGEISQNLLKLIKPELRLELRSALYQAVQRQSAIESRGLRVTIEEQEEIINVHIRPVLRVGDVAKGFILVIFEPSQEEGKPDIQLLSDEPVARQMEEELVKVKLQLRASNEQHDFQAEEMKAANEELQAMNEELRSAAEELETSKEEMQSINEELRTVNQELKVKIEETSIASNNLQNLINSTDIGTIFLDRGLRVAFFTPAISGIFNLITTDYGRQLTDITHKLDYHDLLSDAESVLERLNPIEKEVRTVNGKIYLLRITAYRTNEDRIKGVVITFVDITERRKAEESLRKSEENYRIQLQLEVEQRTKELFASRNQYQTLVENTPDGISRWDKNLRLVYANSAYERKMRSGHEELIGKTNAEMGLPDHIAGPFTSSLKKAFDTGKTVEHLNSFPSPQGDVYFFWRLTPERNNTGEVETVLAIARDITDLKRAELDIRSGREFLQSIIDSSLDKIQVFDAVRDESGAVIDFTYKVNNRKAAVELGDLVAKSLLQQDPGVLASGVYDRMVNVVNTGQANEQEQHYEGQHPDNEWFYLAIVKQGDGVILTSHNISRQKKADQELLQLKDELAQRATDKYVQLFNSIDEGFCIIEVLFDEKDLPYDYQFIEANQAFEIQTGLSEAVGKTIRELSPDHEEFWYETYGRIAKTGQPERFEHVAKALGFHYEVYAFRVDPTPGGDPHVAVLFNDISKRIKEEEVKSFILKLSDALRPLHDPLAIEKIAMEMLGTQLGVNRAFYSEVLPDGDTLVTRSNHLDGSSPFLGSLKMTELDSLLAQEAHSGKTLVIDNIQSSSPNDQVRHAFKKLNIGAAMAVPLLKEGKMVALVTVHQSTPRHWAPHDVELMEEVVRRTWAAMEGARVENALRQSEEKYRTLFETMEEGYAVCQAIRSEDGKLIDYRFIQLNPAFQKLTRLRPEQAIGKTMMEVLPETDDRRLQAYQKVLDTRESVKFENFIPDLNKWYVVTAFYYAEEQFATFYDEITERKHAEETIRKSEAQLRALVKNLPGGAVFIVDQNLRLLVAEGEALNATGLLSEEVVGKTIGETFSPGLLRDFEPFYRKALSGQPFEFEHQVNEHTFISRGAPLSNANGEVYAAMGISYNITERKKAELALSISEEKLRVTMESAIDFAIITMNANREVQQWNTGAERIFGFSFEEMQGQSGDIIFTEEDIATGAPRQEEHTAATKGYAEDERWHKRKDGSLVYMSGVMRPIFNSGITGYVKVARDMTQQKQAEEQLRIFEERNRIALQSAEMAAWDWNVLDDKTVWNNQHYRLFGLEPIPGERDSAYFVSFIYPADKNDVIASLTEAVESTGIYKCEFRIVRADTGEVRWMSGFGRAIEWQNKRASRMVGVMFDVTDRKKLEQQKEDFLSIASHELKTPVTSIQAYGELLEQTFEDLQDESSVNLLRKMNAQVSRLNTLISDLLDTTKITEGQLSLDLQDFDLTALIQQVVDDMQQTSSKHQLEVMCVNTNYIQADKKRIHQVLSNLISNAIKYSPDGGKVVINCALNNEEVKVSIADQGVGIDPDVREKIFNRFFRVQNAKLNTLPGMGLGLYISAGIIHRHRGTIGVNSNDGRGSIFFFTLPQK